MDAEVFAKRLVARLRKRSAEYDEMANNHFGSNEAAKEDAAHERVASTALSETADCIEETLSTFDEE